MRIARSGDMDHRRDVVVHQPLIERIPPAAIRQGRIAPAPTGRIGVEVGGDEAKATNAPLEFVEDRLAGRHTGRLRQLAGAHEALRVHLADPMHQVVAVARPGHIARLIGVVMVHAQGLGRKDGEVHAPLIHLPELIRFNASADFRIRYSRGRLVERLAGACIFGHLTGSKRCDLRWCGGEMSVAVDDHGWAL